MPKKKVLTWEESCRTFESDGFRGFGTEMTLDDSFLRQYYRFTLLDAQHQRNLERALRKKEVHCKICGISGPTKCTEQANCLNVSLEAERKAYGK